MLQVIQLDRARFGQINISSATAWHLLPVLIRELIKRKRGLQFLHQYLGYAGRRLGFNPTDLISEFDKAAALVIPHLRTEKHNSEQRIYPW